MLTPRFPVSLIYIKGIADICHFLEIKMSCRMWMKMINFISFNFVFDYYKRIIFVLKILSFIDYFWQKNKENLLKWHFIKGF